MKPIAVLAFALALGATPPLHAQTTPGGLTELAQGAGDFLPAEEELPLDQLMDDFEWLDTPAGEAAEAGEAGEAGGGGEPEAATLEPASPPAAEPEAEPAAAAIPADWVRREKFGLRFAVPPDWTVQEDDTRGFSVGTGGETQGVVFNVMLEPPEVMDDLPPNAEVTDEPDFEVGPGAVFRQRVVDAKMGPVTFHGRLFLSDAPYQDDYHLVFMMVVIGLPPDEVAETLAAVLASVEADPPPELAPAPAPVASGLDIDGLVRHKAPPGWSVAFRRSDGIVFATPAYDAHLTIAMGEAARKILDLGGQFAAAPQRYEDATILGEPAILFEGVSRDADIQAGRERIAGMKLVHALKRCLADGSPIAIARIATPETFAAGGFDGLLAAIELTLPGDAIACPAFDGAGEGAGGGRPVEPEPRPATPVSPTTENWAFYRNARFGTTLAYPAERFIAQPPSENDDGRRFVSPDGAVQFIVYAGHNVLGKTIDDLLSDEIGFGGFESVTDRQVSASRFSIEGTREGKTVLHMKIIDEADVIHTLLLEADAGASAWLTGPVLQRMRLSFGVEPGAIGGTIGIGGQPVEATPGDPALELAFWQAIADSGDPADFEAYLAQWPGGTFAALAANRLNRLRQAATPTQPIPGHATGNARAGQAQAVFYTRLPGTPSRSGIRSQPVEIVDIGALEGGMPYMHNGSMMWVYPEHGLIVYDRPRSGLSVRRGTVLFKGQPWSADIDGNTVIRGHAVTFRKGCEAAGYEVRGMYHHTYAAFEFTLEGPAPVRRKGSCDIIGYDINSGNAKLRFDAAWR